MVGVAVTLACAAAGVTLLVLAPWRSEPAVTRPNIVLIVVDTLRRDRLDLRGGRNAMPFVAARARRGVVFDRFYANASFTVPSHFAMFTSQLPDSADWVVRHSFVEQLRELGYRTIGLSANPLVGEQYVFNLGFDSYDAALARRGVRAELTERLHRLDESSGQPNPLTNYMTMHLATTADRLNPELTAMLSDSTGADVQAPLFLFVNYLDPHDPYFPHETRRLGINYNREDRVLGTFEFLRRAPSLTDGEVAEVAALYDGEVRFVDRHIAELVAWFEKQGLAKRTVFIVTSDHGELLGEHHLFGHSLALYDEEVEVPFVVFGAGVRRLRVRPLASHLDTAGIILALVGGTLDAHVRSLDRRRTLPHWHQAPGVVGGDRSFLPAYCQGDLLRLTSPGWSAFYLRPDGREQIDVYRRGDHLLSRDLYPQELDPTAKERLERELRAIAAKRPTSPGLTPEQVRELANLGYLR